MIGMCQWPLTAEQYRTLIDCKYRADQGWALLDDTATVRGWHPYVPGDPHWAHRHDAWRGFLPDSKRRAWRKLRGWTVVVDIDVEHLNAFLSQAKTEGPHGDHHERH